MRSNNAVQHERILRFFARYVDEVRDAGLAGVVIDDERLTGSEITVDGRKLINFGNCSYSGLSVDPRLKAASIDLIERYGTSYSSSVAYSSISPLSDLQSRIGEMFGGTALVASTTTLAHLAALPVIVSPDALVLVDGQAHASVHLASQVLKSNGIAVQVLPHNDMSALERAISDASDDYSEVWYLADGVYSMSGDVAPLDRLASILVANENMWMYLDDAHGFGWAGDNGAGLVAERFGMHERLVVAVSLSKSFGAGGGAVVFPNADMAHRVVVSAGPLNFGGPLQPAAIGAGLAATSVMLSDEISAIRRRIDDQIDLVLNNGRMLGLPFAAWERTPIWFVRVGRHDDTVEVAKRVLADGFYINPASFPIVPKGHSGIRFTHTLINTDEDILALLNSIARHVVDVVGERIIDLRSYAASEILPAND